jgi:hypothetical protein
MVGSSLFLKMVSGQSWPRTCSHSFVFLFDASFFLPRCRPDGPPPGAITNSSETTFAAGTVAAFALAGVLFAIISTIGLFFVWRKHNRRRNHLQSGTWNDKNYAVFNSKPGYGGSLRNSWRFTRRTRASSDFASFGAKGETMTLESGAYSRMEGAKSLKSESNVWQREAVEGSVRGISLPVLSKHPAESEFATSPESKHPYSVYDPTSRSAEMKNSLSSTVQDDMDLTSVALANLKNKGKARQITGADSMVEESRVETGSRLSFSPNDLLHGLHLRMSSGKNFSRIKPSQGSVSLSLHPSASPVPGQPGRLRHSYLSSFHAASNPSTRKRESQRPTSPTETLPSVPRSVSDSNSNTIMSDYRQGSRRFLLEDQTELDERDERGEDLDSIDPLPPPPHVYRNQGNLGTVPNSFSLRQVVRSLSPRISQMGMEGNQYSNPSMDHSYPETVAEEQSVLEEDQLLVIKAPTVRDSLSSVQFATTATPSLAPLSFPTPAVPPDKQDEDDIGGLPTQSELDGSKLSPILPSLKRTSPFNIRFDWQSERQSRRVSESSRLRVPHFESREDFVQGTSRSRFRLTPLTMTSMRSYAPSQESTTPDVITSFLDFTNSSEDSSVRTNSFSIQSIKSRIFGDSSTQSVKRGGRMAELKSRWSDTTSSTRRRDSSREGTLPSSSVDKSSRRKTFHNTSTITPPAIYVTSEMDPTKVTRPAPQRESDSTQFSTENPTHVHPVLSDVDSHRDSLPSQRTQPLVPPPPLQVDRTTTTTTSGSEESTSISRIGWTTSESSNQFHARLLLANSRYPALPEGTDEASTSSVYLPNPPS